MVDAAAGKDGSGVWSDGTSCTSGSNEPCNLKPKRDTNRWTQPLRRLVTGRLKSMFIVGDTKMIIQNDHPKWCILAKVKATPISLPRQLPSPRTTSIQLIPGSSIGSWNSRAEPSTKYEANFLSAPGMTCIWPIQNTDVTQWYSIQTDSGGILGDAPGYGKTATTIGLIDSSLAEKPPAVPSDQQPYFFHSSASLAPWPTMDKAACGMLPRPT